MAPGKKAAAAIHSFQCLFPPFVGLLLLTAVVLTSVAPRQPMIPWRLSNALSSTRMRSLRSPTKHMRARSSSAKTLVQRRWGGLRLLSPLGQSTNLCESVVAGQATSSSSPSSWRTFASSMAGHEEGKSAALTPLRSGAGNSHRIAVLGGGFGGLYTALKLAELKWEEGAKPEVTLVDVSDRFLFKPLMYELITGEATLDQVAPLFRDLIGISGVRFVQHEVKSVTLSDTANMLAGQVKLDDDSTIDYDYLVLGVGAEANLELATGAREHALAFNTLDDVRKLEQRLQDIEDAFADKRGDTVSVAVVGGGPSGVELAATVSDRLQKSLGREAVRVTLYVAGADLMETFAPEARDVARETLASKNIEVLYNHRVEEVGKATVPSPSSSGSSSEYTKEGRGEEDVFELRVQRQGEGEEEGGRETIACDMVLWTAGAKPIGVMGIPQEDGANVPITIEKTLKIKGRDREFALGDVAGMGLPATAQVAMQQSDYCAWNIFASVNAAVGDDDTKLLNFRYQHLGSLMALGSLSGTATLNLPGVGDLTLKGPLASALRKMAYVYRMPTNAQRLKVGSEWLQNPDLFLPPKLPQDPKEFEKLNPFVGTPNLDKLFNEKEIRNVLGALYDRFQAETRSSGSSSSSSSSRRRSPPGKEE